MPLVSFDDFFDYWVVTGAGTPIPDQTTAARDMALTGGATEPKGVSYSRRRGAEFRSSSISNSKDQQGIFLGDDDSGGIILVERHQYA